MFISDDEKPGRKEALSKLMSMMSDKTGERLSGIRRSADEGFQDGNGDDSSDDDGEGGSNFDQGSEDDQSDMGPSEEEKEKITALYHKYCA